MADASAPAAPPLRAVLARRGVLATFALNLAQRLPLASIGVLLILHVSEDHGYAAAGVVDGIVAVTLAISAALWGRAVQHVPMTRVLAPLAVAHGAAITVAGLMPSATSVLWFGVIATVIGMTEPPMGATMRVLWDHLLDRDDERHVGYAIDGAAGELMFTASPAVFIGGVAAVGGTSTALIAAGLISIVAGVGFALAPAVRRVPATPPEQRSRGVIGAFAHPGVRTGALLFVLLGLHIGPIELSVAAFGRGEGGTGTVGVLIALWSVGGVVAGFALSRLAPAADPARRIAWMLAWSAGWTALLPFAPTPALLAVPLVLSGAVLTPIFITFNGSFDRIAPPGIEAEIYNVTMAGMLIGIVAGAPACGALVDALGPSAGFGIAIAGPLLGAALLVTRSRDFAPRT